MAPALAALALCYGASLVTADEYDESQIKITREALKGKKVGFVPLRWASTCRKPGTKV